MDFIPEKSTENHNSVVLNLNNFFLHIFIDTNFECPLFRVPGYHVQEMEGTQNGGSPQDSHLEKSLQ